MNDRVVLGIDPGTGRCGWAVIGRAWGVGSGATQLIDCGLIETKPKTPLPERLEIIYTKIDEVIRKFKVDEVAIEELFFVKNIKTGISVAHARGVTMLAARLHKLPISEYKPNEIKLAIVGYGHATKDQMQRMLRLQLKNCTVKQDDTVDAIAIALVHLQSKRFFYTNN